MALKQQGPRHEPPEESPFNQTDITVSDALPASCSAESGARHWHKGSFKIFIDSIIVDFLMMTLDLLLGTNLKTDKSLERGPNLNWKQFLSHEQDFPGNI